MGFFLSLSRAGFFNLTMPLMMTTFSAVDFSEEDAGVAVVKLQKTTTTNKKALGVFLISA